MKNKIRRHFPNFFEGFDYEETQFNTFEDLRNIPWVKKWEEDKEFYKWRISGTALVGEFNNGEKCFVAGFIDKPKLCVIDKEHDNGM